MTPTITGVLARIHVDDLESALPLYVRLADGAQPHRFTFRDVSLAWVGPFLLLQGADDAIRSRAATLTVSDIDAVASAVVESGGELLEGPADAPNGPRLIARSPDGTVLEYIQLR